MKRFARSFLCILLALWTFTASVFCASAVDTVSGDVNSDGLISSEDARIIMRICVGAEAVSSSIIRLADINHDGTVTSEDARIALRSAVGLESTENYGEIIGYSSNNYPIYRKNGITYIDGIIIVNKTYSLPSDYSPDGLLSECTAAFNRMKKDASAKGLNIYISSGYRSYASQKSIYNRYVSRDGKKLADTYSARPGHSEHQSGLSIDLNTITQSFGKTKEGRWVAENCYKYGFILRYPQGKADKTGYRYEPWHLRYVGIEKATAITKSGLCLEEYYGITSLYQ